MEALKNPTAKRIYKENSNDIEKAFRVAQKQSNFYYEMGKAESPEAVEINAAVIELFKANRK